MMREVTDNDRMSLLLNLLDDFTVHTEISQKATQLRQFGVAAGIFREQLLPYMPKITNQLARQLKDDPP